ncbi:MAG: DNA-binding protein [Sphingobacteriales bacterium]|nr:MAG: DNA-binding protein [Sphingobacteriales bacterium]
MNTTNQPTATSDRAAAESLLTVPQLSEYLGLSVSTIHKMTSKRTMPFYRPGGKVILFRKNEIDEWLLKHRQPSLSEIRLQVSGIA